MTKFNIHDFLNTKLEIKKKQKMSKARESILFKFG